MKRARLCTIFTLPGFLFTSVKIRYFLLRERSEIAQKKYRKIVYKSGDERSLTLVNFFALNEPRDDRKETRFLHEINLP